MEGQFFNEIYGNYYNTMALVIEAAQNGTLDREILYKIVGENSFAESVVPITDSVIEERWPLVNSGFKTPLKEKPRMPLTVLQKQFVKSMLLDERAGLFFEREEIDSLLSELGGVEPLFPAGAVECFDRYADGDDYASAEYRRNFRAVLDAIHRGNRIRISAVGRDGILFEMSAMPERLEYSPKDDKFRICFARKSKYCMLNMANVRSVEPCKAARAAGDDVLEQRAGDRFSGQEDRKVELVLEVTDERNALDRVLIAFSHLEKSCSRIGEARYRLTVAFDASDTPEMVVRVLQLGPYVKAVAPDFFVEQIKTRLRKQKRIWKNIMKTDFPSH